MIVRVLACFVVVGVGSSAWSCPLPESLRTFDETIPASALPEIGDANITKPQARLLLVRLEEFRQVHLEGYRKSLGSYGAYIIETDKTLELNRKSCRSQYENLHNAISLALTNINGIHREHYREFVQKYKTRVRFAKQIIFF